MKVDVAVQACGRPFLDTAPVIYGGERNPSYVDRVDRIFDLIDTQAIQVCTSPVTLAECIIAPMRLGDTQLVADFTAQVVSGPGVQFILIDDRVAERPQSCV